MDAISTQNQAASTALSRLKGTKTGIAGQSGAPTSAEQRLTDLLDLSPAAKEKLQQSRKLNNYLQVFSTALKWVNGGKKLPDLASYFTADTLPSKKTGKVDIKT